MQPPPLRFLSACKQPKAMTPGIHINPYVQPRVEGAVVHHDHVLTNRRTWAIPVITNGSLLQRGVSSLKSCLMLWVSRLPSQVCKGLGIHSSSSTQRLDHLFQLLIFFLTEKSMAEVYNCMQMYYTIILRVFWKWITIFTLDIEMWSTGGVALSDHASGALCLFAKGCIESFVHLQNLQDKPPRALASAFPGLHAAWYLGLHTTTQDCWHDPSHKAYRVQQPNLHVPNSHSWGFSLTTALFLILGGFQQFKAAIDVLLARIVQPRFFFALSAYLKVDKVSS